MSKEKESTEVKEALVVGPGRETGAHFLQEVMICPPELRL